MVVGGYKGGKVGIWISKLLQKRQLCKGFESMIVWSQGLV